MFRKSQFVAALLSLLATLNVPLARSESSPVSRAHLGVVQDITRSKKGSTVTLTNHCECENEDHCNKSRRLKKGDQICEGVRVEHAPDVEVWVSNREHGICKFDRKSVQLDGSRCRSTGLSNFLVGFLEGERKAPPKQLALAKVTSKQLFGSISRAGANCKRGEDGLCASNKEPASSPLSRNPRFASEVQFIDPRLKIVIPWIGNRSVRVNVGKQRGRLVVDNYQKISMPDSAKQTRVLVKEERAKGKFTYKLQAPKTDHPAPRWLKTQELVALDALERVAWALWLIREGDGRYQLLALSLLNSVRRESELAQELFTLLIHWPTQVPTVLGIEISPK